MNAAKPSAIARSATAKAMRRLAPFLMLLYFFNFTDHASAGFDALTMNEDLGFSRVVFAWTSASPFL